MNKGMKIGEIANATGLRSTTFRHYELNRLLECQGRWESVQAGRSKTAPQKNGAKPDDCNLGLAWVRDIQIDR